MTFTDYYAEASCTAGRAISSLASCQSEPDLTTVGQAGSTCRHAGAGADHRHGAQVDGVRDRSVRQEPSRRSQRVSADIARLRRVLGLSLPSGCDGGSIPSQLSAKTCRPRSVRETCCIAPASDVDDQTVDPRWGKVGKQKITDEGPLPPHPTPGIKYDMETVDAVVLDRTERALSTRPRRTASRSSCG